MLAPKTMLQNRYEIVRQIGQGGMGSVYEAIDRRLHATVALKETLFSDSSMQRAFEREAKLLARLRHQALPKVIDYFFEGNRQFLVMEFVAGDDLATRMERSGGKFPSAEVVPWVVRWADQLLQALEYLHTQNPPAIHRDIKPQNLKLTARGDIVLLDFGLARGGLADISTVTARGNVEGYTPNYAPLEQIRGSAPEPRSDLYSLAATLYHLLTGERPPDALTRAANLLNNQSDPLRPANELNSHIPPPVAAVLNRAMSLNPDQRPASAAAMQKELQEAQQPKGGNGGGGGGSGGGGGIGTADTPIVTQNLHVTAQTLQVSGPAGEPALPTQKLASDDPPGTLLRAVSTGSPILSVAFNRDGATVATSGEDNTINLWDMSEGKLLHTLEGHTSPARSIAFSPDGKMLASGSGDGTVRLWWVKDGSEAYTTEVEAVESIAFNADGTQLAAGGWSSAVSLFQVVEESLEEVDSLSASFVHCLAFSADGKLLAAGCYDTNVLVWQVHDGHLQHTLEGHTNFVLALAFHPDSRSLASGGGGSSIRVWRMRDGRQIDTLVGHSNFVHSIQYSPDGKLLASGSADGTARLWKVDSGMTWLTLNEHADGVTSLAFSPDGLTLVTGSRDEKLRLWQIGE